MSVGLYVCPVICVSEDVGRIVCLSGDLRERDRIGCIAQELCLVQVDACARYGTADGGAGQVILNQCAA